MRQTAVLSSGFARKDGFALRWARRLLGLALALVAQPLRADAPAGRYVVMADGVVDAETGLEWQSTISADGMSWSNATSYCASLAIGAGGWRLPSATEAATLIDESRVNPALDSTAFPNAPIGVFWTATALPEYSGVYAWTISSGNGAITFFATSQPSRVRCVRSMATTAN